MGEEQAEGLKGRRVPLTALVAELYNAPVAIHAGALDVILGSSENATSTKALEEIEAYLDYYDDGLRAEDGIGVVRVRGSLYKGMFYNDMDLIKSAFDDALEQYAGVILDVDSPGGTTSGMLDLADHIFAARGEKPIVAFANDSMASAAYVIASAADKVFGTRTAQVGSLGVLARHVDVSKRNEQDGVKITEIASGEKKTMLSRNRPLSKSARAELEELVAKQAEELYDTVARHRKGLTAASVEDQEAGLFVGEDGVTAKLLDGIRTFDQVVEEVRELASSGSATRRRGTRASADAEEATMADGNDDTKGKGTEAGQGGQASVTDITTARTEGTAAGRQEERDRMKQIEQACALVGAPERFAEFVQSEMSAEEVRQALQDEMAKNGGKVDKGSTAASGGSGQDNDDRPIDGAPDSGGGSDANAGNATINMNAYYDHRKKTVAKYHTPMVRIPEGLLD